MITKAHETKKDPNAHTLKHPNINLQGNKHIKKKGPHIIQYNTQTYTHKHKKQCHTQKNHIHTYIQNHPLKLLNTVNQVQKQIHKRNQLYTKNKTQSKIVH